MVKPGRRLKPASVADGLGTTKSNSAGERGPIVDIKQNDKVILSAEIVD